MRAREKVEEAADSGAEDNLQSQANELWALWSLMIEEHTSLLEAARLFQLSDANTLRFTKGSHEWSRLRTSWLELYCSGNVVSDVARGLKTVESRMFSLLYRDVAPGWFLFLRDSVQNTGIWVLVTAVERHDSFAAAARVHGRSLYPWLQLDQMSDTEIEHALFLLNKGNRATESSLRKWFYDLSKPGSVVCWHVRVLPERLSIRVVDRVGTLKARGHEASFLEQPRRHWLRFGRLSERLRLRPRIQPIQPTPASFSAMTDTPSVEKSQQLPTVVEADEVAVAAVTAQLVEADKQQQLIDDAESARAARRLDKRQGATIRRIVKRLVAKALTEVGSVAQREPSCL